MGLGRLVAPAVACAACVGLLAFTAVAGAAGIGANDDTGKYTPDGGAAFFRQMAAIGLRQTVMTLRFAPSEPARIADQARLDEAIPNAVAAGLRVVLAVYPYPPRELEAGLGSPQAFASWLTAVATRYPQVRQFVVLNEPNQPAFLRPQFGLAGVNASAAVAGAYLAAAYDALKAVDPAIRVVGVGLSPRGNDNPRATSNISTSPVRFLEALGRWYRSSGRAAPLMDGFSFHPYPNQATDPLAKGYRWPDAGFANLDRVKQALWDAFGGTAQATTVTGLQLYLDEVGWQVDTTGLTGYTGLENVPVTNEAAQAAIYADLVRQAACDPDVAEVNFFGFRDDGLRTGFQAGLYRADGSQRPAATAVAQAIAETSALGCTGVPVVWAPATGVVGARASGPVFDASLRLAAGAPLAVSIAATAAEGAVATATVERVGGTPSVLERLLSGRQSRVAAAVSADVTPVRNTRLTISLPAGLPRGSYVVNVRFAAEANERRETLVRSPRFVVR